MVAVGLLFLAGGFLLVAPLLTGNQQRVSMHKARSRLVSAYREFTNTGSFTSFRRDVWLSSNTVAIGNTQYQCFLELRHGGGTLAITSNLACIWLGPNGVSKIISDGLLDPAPGY
jgi:hypothetical protein